MNTTDITNSQNLQQSNQETDQSLKKTESSVQKIRIYEIVMVLVFLVLAIPLFAFIFKSRIPKQTKTTGTLVFQPTITAPSIIPTPTPIVIKSISDLNKVSRDMNDLSGDQFGGIINQFDNTVKNLLK